MKTKQKIVTVTTSAKFWNLKEGDTYLLLAKPKIRNTQCEIKISLGWVPAIFFAGQLWN